MNDSSKNARDIFLAAAKLAPDQWDSYLDRVCEADDELRRRVAELLRAHQEIGSFLDQPAIGPAAVGRAPAPTAVFLDEAEGPGSVIGPYKLLQQIGEGGMGTVFMAEQTHPVRRRVALKLIKPGMDTAQVIARFEAERQALALMDHPNIAKVLDVGTVGQAFQPDAGGASQAGKPDLRGRPYFVMELVKGISITKYCDDNHLTPGERLELVIPVCQAVQHAHQKGIIHRDLKPSNVLVALYDGRPVPKVIDFGVAKATSQKLTERTMFTQYGQIVGTLEYMSPEQAELNQLDIDTRSDIYSLGVLLYELLTGTTPFARKRLREAAFDEMLRIIREEEPPKPSTRLSTTDELTAIAANRKTEPRKLSDVVRGELDWIVMKALEKDRARRYEAANGLAMDIQRYLADEPVLAGAPSAAYRFRKFARRNRVALSTAALVLAALVVGTCVSVWQAVRATRAEDLAQALLKTETAARNAAVASQQAAEKARQDEAAQRAVAEERFQLAQDAVDQYLKDVTDDEDLKRADFNKLRKRLLQSAVPFYQKFVEQKSGDPELEAARGKAYYRLALVRAEMGENQAARADYERMRTIFTKLAAEFPTLRDYRSDLATSHSNLGVLLKSIGKSREAEAAYRAALTIQKKLAAEFPTVPEYRRAVAVSHINLGVVLDELGEQEAEYRAAQTIQEKLAA
ncbi:MAG TPA: serine/threonine-protein kinase, partial [Pirellulales bacterium]|nr:serine/threonine-protein kinase [Pirellulales bacterium]